MIAPHLGEVLVQCIGLGGVLAVDEGAELGAERLGIAEEEGTQGSRHTHAGHGLVGRGVLWQQ